MSTPSVFLDRDGVINKNYSDYVKNWEEFEFLPGSLDALKELASCPWRIVIATNQSLVGRGIISVDHLNYIHNRMLAVISDYGGRIDAIYVCRHHPNAGCYCRKPSPGLLVQAGNELDIDLPESVFIGDSQRDILAAIAVKVKPIFIDNQNLTSLGSASVSILSGQPLEKYLILPNLPIAVETMLVANRLGITPGKYIRNLIESNLT